MYAFPCTRRHVTVLFSFLLLLVLAGLSLRTGEEAEYSQCPQCESCTSVLVGRLASEDGSTMTSHSCDSGTDRTWISIEPRRSYGSGAMDTVWMDAKRTRGPDDSDLIPYGEIPQVAETWKFMNAASGAQKHGGYHRCPRTVSTASGEGRDSA